MLQDALLSMCGGFAQFSDLLKIIFLFMCKNSGTSVHRYLWVQWTGYEKVTKCSNKSENIWATEGILSNPQTIVRNSITQVVIIL